MTKSTGKSIYLTLTDNTSSMLSVIAKNNRISVRLQRIFLSADLSVIDEIVSFIKNRKGKLPLFREFLKENLKSVKKSPRKTCRISTRGRHHNLADIYAAVNKQYFNGSVDSLITWGLRNSRRFARRRTLGSYDSNANVIRIHPMLDSQRVPGYFISFVVYHEMLHAHLGVQERNGRRSVHSARFREKEKAFTDYARAIAWEKKNI